MRRGRTQPCHIGRISLGGPGRATTTRPSGRSTHQPGAVPRSLGTAVDEGISHACLRFVSGKPIPRRSKRWRSHCSSFGSTRGRSPTTAAIASRVRSSGVGPRPPVVTTRSAAESASPNAALTVSSLSGSASIQATSTPTSASDRARSPLLVSRVSPAVISLPTASRTAVWSGLVGGCDFSMTGVYGQRPDPALTASRTAGCGR